MQKFLNYTNAIINERGLSYPKELYIFADNHNIPEEDITWLGEGDNGIAYETNDHRVIKQTSNKNEFDIASKLLKDQTDETPFAKIYAVEKINSYYFILEEKVKQNNKLENLYYQAQEIWESQGLDILNLDNIDLDDVEDQQIIDFINELSHIAFHYRFYANIPDLWLNNLGYNQNNQLVAFDLTDKNIY